MPKFNCTNLAKLFRRNFKNTQFSRLKLADITPVFKKKHYLNKEIYRSVSILPVVSKIFEGLMQKQATFFTERLSYLCGYTKGFCTQQALTPLIEKWKKILDRKGYGGPVLIDLSEGRDTEWFILYDWLNWCIQICW